MQQFDITVPTLGTFPVHAAGRYIKYVAGNNGGGDTSLVVTPGAAGGSRITLQVGQAYRIADNRPTPDSWILQNAAGGAPILGKVVIGDGRIDDNSIAGTVQVVDGGKARTLGNTAFTLASYSQAVAGQYSRLQLWNPAANTSRLVVEALTLWATNASNMTLNDSAVQLATLYDTGRPKKLGGTVSAAAAYYDSTAAAQPISGMSTYPVVAAQLQAVKLNEPIIVPPGRGLLVSGNVLANQIQVNWEWYEEPNI